MNARGIAGIILGWWVVSQVLLGDALDRIGVFGAGAAAAKSSPSHGGFSLPKVPDIPLVPQGPVTGIPFFPVSTKRTKVRATG